MNGLIWLHWLNGEHKMKNLNGNITISRHSKNKIYITIQDELSNQKFIDIELTHKQFSEAITGLSFVECEFQVSALERIGKKKVTEQRSIIYTGNHSYNKTSQEQWLLNNAQEEGWSINYYLGSHNSIKYNQQDSTTTLNYSVYKYVDVE